MKCLLLIRRQLHYSCLEHGLVVLKTRYILFVIVRFFPKTAKRERERERERERDPKSSVLTCISLTILRILDITG